VGERELEADVDAGQAATVEMAAVSHTGTATRSTGTVASRAEMAAWCTGTGTTGRTPVGIKP
jgi:hypothetical protein